MNLILYTANEYKYEYKYIYTGKRPKLTRKNGRVIRKLKDKKKKSNNKYTYTSSSSVTVMTLQQEKEYLSSISNNYRSSNSSTRSSDNENGAVLRKWWIPPPPFSSSGLAIRRTNYHNHGDHNHHNHGDDNHDNNHDNNHDDDHNHDIIGITKRLPVQYYGSSRSSIQQRAVLSTTEDASINNDDESKSKSKSKSNNYNFYFPKNNKNIPEVAIIGRSNVGKSTLLNALLYGNQIFDATLPRPLSMTSSLVSAGGSNTKRNQKRKAVMMPKGKKAVTSDRPGETREIMFYKISCAIEASSKVSSNQNQNQHDKQNVVGEDIHIRQQQQQLGIMSMFLVDLPGYGFSYSSEDQKQVWREMMQTYILSRGKNLKRIMLLIDARHGFKSEDIAFIEDLQRHLSRTSRRDLPPMQIVLTKCDLVEQLDLARKVVEVKESFSNVLKREPSSLPVMLVSAKPGIGYNNLSRKQDRMYGGILQLQRELASLVPTPV